MRRAGSTGTPTPSSCWVAPGSRSRSSRRHRRLRTPWSWRSRDGSSRSTWTSRPSSPVATWSSWASPRAAASRSLAHLLRPRRFLALELQARSNAALDAFLQDHDLSDSVRTEYGIDQSDVRRVATVVDEHFGHHDLDLVVDDASHLQLPTAASFDVLFPRLRPGGVYVLEDWSTGHTSERVARALDAQRGSQRAEPYVHEETDLSRIVLDLVMTAAYSPETVAELRILNGFMYRGEVSRRSIPRPSRSGARTATSARRTSPPEPAAASPRSPHELDVPVGVGRGGERPQLDGAPVGRHRRLGGGPVQHQVVEDQQVAGAELGPDDPRWARRHVRPRRRPRPSRSRRRAARLHDVVEAAGDEVHPGGVGSRSPTARARG